MMTIVKCLQYKSLITLCSILITKQRKIWLLNGIKMQIMHSIQIYTMKLSNATMQANGILVEAKKFDIVNPIMRAAMLFTSFIFFTAIISERMNIDILRQLPFAISSPQSNTFYYILAFIAAVQLFALAFIHIVFQANISKRRLPQFNKRGAAYDTI